MIARPLLLATALLAASATARFAQDTDRDVIAAPVLRASVTRHRRHRADRRRHRQRRQCGADRDLPRARSRHHRLAAGRAGAQRAARAPGDRRRHQGPQRDLGDAAGPHASRPRTSSKQVARALERTQRPRRCRQSQPDLRPRSRRCQARRLQHRRACSPTAVRYEPRNNRFDVTFEICNENGTAATKLRFTGTAIETVEAAVLARNVERNEVLKSSDVVVERRPKAEVGARRRRAATARSACRRAGSSAPARRCGSPISPSPTWCSATRTSR